MYVCIKLQEMLFIFDDKFSIIARVVKINLSFLLNHNFLLIQFIFSYNVRPPIVILFMTSIKIKKIYIVLDVDCQGDYQIACHQIRWAVNMSNIILTFRRTRIYVTFFLLHYSSSLFFMYIFKHVLLMNNIACKNFLFYIIF